MKTLLTAAAVALVATMGAHAETAPATTVRAFIDTMFNDHHVAEAFQKYVGSSYTQHNPNVPDGREGGIAGLSAFVGQNPDMKASIKRVIAQGDLVAIHYNLITRPGDRGAAIIDIFRLQDGKIVEHWDVVEPVPADAKNTNGMF